MKKNVKIDPNAIKLQVYKILAQLRKYSPVLFLLLLAAVYGFVLFRASQLISAQPSDSDVSSQTQSAVTPHVDPAAVDQLQALQDNSVSVKSLFDQARSNPFQE